MAAAFYMFAMAGEPQTGSLVEMRLGHLGMIQDVVARLAGYSASVKNFSITVAAGAVALAFTSNQFVLLWIAAAAAVLFGFLDAYYLALERSFRSFYEEVAERPISKAGDLKIAQTRFRWWCGEFSWLRALISPSVWPFYLPQLIVAVLLILSR